MNVLAVVGSRDYCDYDTFYDFMRGISELCAHYDWDLNRIIIISGGARGADSMAEQFAEDDGLPFIEFSAEWSKYGRAAGMIRNGELVDKCDALVAFWDGLSPGTADSIERAQVVGKIVRVVFYDEQEREDGAVLL